MSFGYDRYGNLLSQTGTQCSDPNFSFSVNGSNQINGYTYDAAGNLTNDTVHNYSYDAEDRLNSALSINYIHDGSGWRVEKSNGELLWYDQTCGHQLLDVFNLTGGLKSEYYYLGNIPLGSRNYFYYTDRIGSVRVMTDLNGNLQEDSDYYPFGGELQFVSNSNIDAEHKFTGKRRDITDTTEFDYSHLRMYNSAIGRWLETDPIKGNPKDPQTLNRYNYVRNNPANLVDPSGGLLLGLGWCFDGNSSGIFWNFGGIGPIQPFPMYCPELPISQILFVIFSSGCEEHTSNTINYPPGNLCANLNDPTGGHPQFIEQWDCSGYGPCCALLRDLFIDSIYARNKNLPSKPYVASGTDYLQGGPVVDCCKNRD